MNYITLPYALISRPLASNLARSSFKNLCLASARFRNASNRVLVGLISDLLHTSPKSNS